MYHTLHMRCCRPDLVIDIFFFVGLSCEGLKSPKVFETGTRNKKNETIVEGQRLRTVHIMERTCTRMRAQIYLCMWTGTFWMYTQRALWHKPHTHTTTHTNDKHTDTPTQHHIQTHTTGNTHKHKQAQTGTQTDRNTTRPKQESRKKIKKNKNMVMFFIFYFIHFSFWWSWSVWPERELNTLRYLNFLAWTNSNISALRWLEKWCPQVWIQLPPSRRPKNRDLVYVFTSIDNYNQSCPFVWTTGKKCGTNMEKSSTDIDLDKSHAFLESCLSGLHSKRSRNTMKQFNPRRM